MKVDLSGQVWAQFEQAQTRAKHHLDEGRSEEAAAEYRQKREVEKGKNN